MPLSKIQADVLGLLASHRDPEARIACGAPDIDVFHDREERVGRAAEEDAAVLEEHGYVLQWLRRDPTIYSVQVERSGEKTKMEWVVDSDYRFFPTMRDEMFGYILHPVDLATNKVMAAVGRRAVRDLVDLVTIHSTILPLGAVIWAAVEKAPGFTPEGLIAEIRRNSHYSPNEWRVLITSEPLDQKTVIQRLRGALAEAEEFVSKMPTDKAGLLFLQGSEVVQPNPDTLEKYQTHAGQRRGQWPSSPEISAAMLERYSKAKPGFPRDRSGSAT